MRAKSSTATGASTIPPGCARTAPGTMPDGGTRSAGSRGPGRSPRDARVREADLVNVRLWLQRYSAFRTAR